MGYFNGNRCTDSENDVTFFISRLVVAQFCYFSFYSRKILEFCLVHSQRTPPRSAIRSARRKSSKKGYRKCPCFLCDWDSRARDKHGETVHWPEREQLQPGSKNVSNVSLVDRENILLPPLHTKLGMTKQFVKALDRNSSCFQYLCTRFSSLSHAKIREGIFDGPQIRKLIQ